MEVRQKLLLEFALMQDLLLFVSLHLVYVEQVQIQIQMQEYPLLLIYFLTASLIVSSTNNLPTGKFIGPIATILLNFFPEKVLNP